MDVTTEEDDIDMDLESGDTGGTGADTGDADDESDYDTDDHNVDDEGQSTTVGPKVVGQAGAIRWSGDWMADLEASRGRLAQRS